MSHADPAESDPKALSSHADPTETARTALVSHTDPAESDPKALASHADPTETARTALASCTDPTETTSKARAPTGPIGSSIPQNDIPSQMQLDDVQAESRNESVEEDIKVARTMLRRLEEGKFTVEEVCSAEVVQRISERLKNGLL